MADREITSVVWHQRHHHIDVTYLGGHTERLMGSEAVAFVLAKNAGLSLAPASDDTRRWVRDPDSRYSGPPRSEA
jgi:hypothetical protein